MAIPILVDTDILIDTAYGDRQAASYLDSLSIQYELAISAITLMELIVGCRDKKQLQDIDRSTEYLTIFGIDGEVTAMSLNLLRQYRLSHNLLLADCLIAATAIVGGIPLTSKNVRDYRFIEELEFIPYP